MQLHTLTTGIYILQFANYLVQEMQSSEHLGSSDEASDDEEDGGWLAHSTFELRPPPVTARQHDNGRRPLSSSEFDVRLAVHPLIPVQWLIGVFSTGCLYPLIFFTSIIPRSIRRRESLQCFLGADTFDDNGFR